MKSLVIKIGIILSILGVIALALNLVFGMGTIQYLEQIKLGSITLYKYNFDKYFINLSNSLQDTSVLTLAWQTRTWTNDLINNLAYIANIFIFGINLLIYPFRVGAYVVKNILALMGVNFMNIEGSNISWLAQLINWLIAFVQGYI